ncbi:MAG: hypothetical protein V4600_23460 [Pseudomonadota bacterium]|uniref:hypothetical protein n=1 Tax=Pseudomonas TaxID=286 RepID=UPI0015A3AB96|nr:MULTISPECIES: hypothetical protein [Pseudomonas]MCT8961025.1 hypothetical protein [Pseudomonas veronii]MDY7553020.1 hypothetical protein [Pseudomonas sp. FG1]MEB0052386.1 hypothetical protein [Pseudomonas sp. FG1]NWC59468.1 hypothetical protein [Pseudomonas veronii]
MKPIDYQAAPIEQVAVIYIAAKLLIQRGDNLSEEGMSSAKTDHGDAHDELTKRSFHPAVWIRGQHCLSPEDFLCLLNTSPPETVELKQSTAGETLLVPTSLILSRFADLAMR